MTASLPTLGNRCECHGSIYSHILGMKRYIYTLKYVWRIIHKMKWRYWWHIFKTFTFLYPNYWYNESFNSTCLLRGMSHQTSNVVHDPRVKKVCTSCISEVMFYQNLAQWLRGTVKKIVHSFHIEKEWNRQILFGQMSEDYKRGCRKLSSLILFRNHKHFSI